MGAASTLPPQFTNETLVTSLREPISMAFLPDGRLLFTERTTAMVRMIVNGHIASTDPLVTVPDVTSEYLERGLEGIAVDPRWPQSPYVYVCFTRTGDVTQLVRYTAGGDLTGASGENLTLGSPYVVLASLPDVNPSHNGLGLRFGKDGHLLMTTGDDGSMCDAQNVSVPVGKLLRIDVSRLPAGMGGPPPFASLIPPGNPFAGPDSTAQLVLAYGLRNPWRFHVDSSNGAVLLADVGWNDWEELDEVIPGHNYGWPYREGPLVWEHPECGPDSGDYAAPIVTEDHASGWAAIMTAGIYRPTAGAPSNWPSIYWGNLFYVDFYGAGPRRLVRAGGTWMTPTPVPGQPDPDNWATGFTYPSDWLVGADGSLYWLEMFDSSQGPATGVFGRIRYTGPPVSIPPEVEPPSELQAAPNPFRDRVSLSWRFAQSTPTTIEILDLSGRIVRRLRGTSGALEGVVEWDGRDEEGNRASSGLYFARLDGDPSPLRSIVLMR
jgi:glucose/arabinose dehydrogenase